GIFPIANDSLSSILDAGEKETVVSHLQKWRECFAQDDFYVGVADHGYEREKARNETFKALQLTHSAPAVAVNDVRYLHKKDAIAYDCLQAVKKGEEWSMRVTD